MRISGTDIMKDSPTPTEQLEDASEAVPTVQTPRPSRKPKYMRNPMRILSALKHEIGKDGLLVSNGELKPGFEWIFDKDTVCCEHIHGVNVNVLMSSSMSMSDIGDRVITMPSGPYMMSTRNCMDICPFENPSMFMAVVTAHRLGYLSPYLNQDTEVPGVIPDRARWVFIPRSKQVFQFRYKQWGKKGPQTIDSTSLWLYEDLESTFYGEFMYKTSARREAPIDISHHQERRNPSGAIRPDGLLFHNPGLGTWARIDCKDFPWFYYESPVTFTSSAFQGRKSLSKTLRKCLTQHLVSLRFQASGHDLALDDDSDMSHLLEQPQAEETD